VFSVQDTTATDRQTSTCSSFRFKLPTFSSDLTITDNQMLFSPAAHPVDVVEHRTLAPWVAGTARVRPLWDTLRSPVKVKNGPNQRI